MNNLKIFCLSLNPSHLKLIKKFNYTPVGLGEADFNDEWMTDKIGKRVELMTFAELGMAGTYTLWLL